MELVETDVLRAWGNLHLVYGAMRRLLDEQLTAEAGCGLFEHDLLTQLDCAPGKRMQMLELADRTGVTRGGLTRIVDRLVDRGWVRRDRPESNRREVYAVITDEGTRTLKRARAVYLRLLDDTLGGHLATSELKKLVQITNKLRKALGDIC